MVQTRRKPIRSVRYLGLIDKIGLQTSVPDQYKKPKVKKISHDAI